MSQVNTKLVLDVVRRSGPISRAELARQTSLPPATVGNIVAELMHDDLLIEVKEGKSDNKNVGRPARNVALNDQARFVLAIDLEPDKLRIMIVGLTLQIQAYSEYSIDRFASSGAIVSQIIAGCRNLLSANAAWEERLVGIGVSLPGEVDTEAGISRGSTNMPNWRDVPILAKLKNAFHKPVQIGRSMHMAALSEKWRRPEIREKNVLFLVLRTGVGMSMLLRGNLYYGASHFDGEIGHTMIDPNGKTCECGKRGCLETFISSHAVKQEAVDLIHAHQAQKLLEMVEGDLDSIRPETVYELAKHGDPDCVKIVRKISRYLGMAAANIVQILNPHEVVICGSIDLAESIIISEIDAVFNETLLPKTRADVSVALSPYKEKAALYGAAALVLDEIFSMPDLTFPVSIAGESLETEDTSKNPSGSALNTA